MRRNTASTPRSGPSWVRWAAGATLVASALLGLAPAAHGLPNGEPYGGDPSPSPSPPKADLVASARFRAVYHGATGDWLGYEAIVTVKNVGDRRADPTTLHVRGEQRDEQGYSMVRGRTHDVGVLYPNQSRTFESLYFRQPCTIELRATADATGAVPESNEANNAVRLDLRRCRG